ncbi:MAG: hypothetical protein HFE75_05135 [Firmicutes bacterium]|jgi:hypothetical protein|nr:hypothetical protein [Bacillota bacterium]
MENETMDQAVETTEELETNDIDQEEPEGAEGQEPEPPETVTEEPEEEGEDPVLEELREAKEEAERRAAEAEERLKRQEALLGRASDSDDPALDMAAEMLGIEPSELEAAVNQELEAEQAAKERESLEEELESLKVEKEMEKDLIEVRKIDPGVKSLVELGETFFKCVAAGMNATEAYHASRAVEEKTTPTPPAEIGKVNQSSVEKDFYTKEEVEAMTAEEVEKNLPKIEVSMKKWK